MRVKSVIIAVLALAVGAVPAIGARSAALRSAPKPVVAKPAVAPAPSVVVRPSAVWIPAPTAGIKWGGPATRPAKPGRTR